MSVRFTVINESFVCQNCGQDVPKSSRTCRNHCSFCLYSLHVDIDPGDRAEVCKGLMQPVDYEIRNGEIVIIHKCQKCGGFRRNRADNDDDLTQLVK